MKKNITSPDRMIRLLIAAVIAILYFTHQIHGTLATVLGIVAIIITITALVNFCPIYYILGISPKKSKKS